MPLISPHYLCVDWIPSVCQAGQHEHVRHASVKWFSAREIFRAMHDKTARHRLPQSSLQTERVGVRLALISTSAHGPRGGAVVRVATTA